MIDPKKIYIAVLKSFWPGGTTSPTIGPMAGDPLTKADNNIDIMGDATELASIVALAQGVDLAIPIDSIKITVTDVGVEEVVGRTPASGSGSSSPYTPSDEDNPDPSGPDPCAGTSYAGSLKGIAIIDITGIEDPPSGVSPATGSEKGLIFSLGNSAAGSSGCAGWFNVRHRTYPDGSSGFDCRGGMGIGHNREWPSSAHCGNSMMGMEGVVSGQAADGIWTIEWDANEGWIEVVSPLSTYRLYIYDGDVQTARFAFDTVQIGGLGGWISWTSHASINLQNFTSVLGGNSSPCGQV